MNGELFFNGWDKLLRTAVMTLCLYPIVIAILRMTGKRTLAKMSGFELLVMTALGTTFADTVLNPEVSLAQGITVYVLLFLLQGLVSLLSARSKTAHRLFKHSPTLLYRNGRMLDEALKKQRVTEEEVREAVREKGHGAMEEIEAIILESDGSFSVIPKQDLPPSAITPEIQGVEA